jgi:hypothetical protein
VGALGPLSVEAALYQWAVVDHSAAELRPLIPSRRHYDPEHSILLLDLAAGAPAPVLPRDGSAESLSAVRGLLASAMAAYHRLVPGPTTELGRLLPRTAPWVFDLARPVPAMLRELSPAQLSVIEALQHRPEAAATLEQLRERWRPERLIHGDFKWTNLLVRQDAGGWPTGILLLDWEMAQLGDPAWDVGAVLHAFLTEAVLTLEPAGQEGAEGAARHLGAAARELGPLHRDFWSRYAAAAELTGQEAAAMLERLPAQVAARLLKTAFEWSQGEARMPRRAAAILQLGINMLANPGVAVKVVLGFGARPETPV